MSYSYLTAGAASWDTVPVKGTANSIAIFDNSGNLSTANNANFKINNLPDPSAIIACDAASSASPTTNHGLVAASSQSGLFGGDNCAVIASNDYNITNSDLSAVVGGTNGSISNSDNAVIIGSLDSLITNAGNNVIVGMRQCDLSGTGTVAIGDDQAQTNAISQNRVCAMRFQEGVSITNNISSAPVAASTLLQLDSTNAALLLPRLTTVEKNALTPVAGMLVYDTTLNQLSFRSNVAWVNL